MTLDLTTLMVVQSFVMACAGVVLLFAWLLNRGISALAVCGLANSSGAAGLFSLMLGITTDQPAWLGLGGGLLSLQMALMWKGARTIDGKRAPLIVALAGPVLAVLVSGIPFMRPVAGSLALSIGAIYIFAGAVSLWHGRDEGLAARWPLMILWAVHAAALAVGTVTTLTGSTGQDTVPSLTSLFGFIYFEDIIFAMGTAVFVLALVKERSEAVGRLAARIDPLSGIANRAGFMENAERTWQRCRHDAAPISVLMFDLDRFKIINDTHGHAIGDAVIRKFCDMTAAALRPQDVFGRLGGEEFAVVLAGSSIEAAFVRAERIRVTFAAACRFLDDRQVDSTVSCGVSASSNAEQTLTALLEEADAALYCSKFEGRNRVRRADQIRPAAPSSTVIRVA